MLAEISPPGTCEKRILARKRPQLPVDFPKSIACSRPAGGHDGPRRLLQNRPATDLGAEADAF
jgi:hypothetical protein